MDLHGNHRAPDTGHKLVHLLGEAQKEPLLPGQCAGLVPEGATGRGSGTGALLPHLVLAGALPQT